jgi:hypothetical protein
MLEAVHDAIITYFYGRPEVTNHSPAALSGL